MTSKWKETVSKKRKSIFGPLAVEEVPDLYQLEIAKEFAKTARELKGFEYNHNRGY